MMKKNQYTVEFVKDRMARAQGIYSVSVRQCVEIASRIRGSKLSKAKRLLNSVIMLKTPIKYTKMNAPHKKNTGPGRYPIKASAGFLKVLESAEANAHFQGLSTDDLLVSTVVVNKSVTTMRSGRIPGRESKKTAILIILEENKKEGKPETKETKAKKIMAQDEPKKSKEEKHTESKKESSLKKSDAKKESKGEM